MSDAGRPVIFDEAKKGQVCTLLRAGCSQRRAAALVGIHEATIRRASREDAAFAEKLAEAKADLEMECLQKIREGGKSWRSAAWLLERRLPTHWGKKPYSISFADPDEDDR